MPGSMGTCSHKSVSPRSTDKPVPSPWDPELGLQVRLRQSPGILKRSVRERGISLLLLRVGDS